MRKVFTYAAASRSKAPVASISCRSQPGATSKPFGQVSAPSSRNTRAKYAGSRNGSIMGPFPSRMAGKSYCPAMPSLKVARSRCPPRCLTFATLIIVQTCDLGQRHAGPCPPPIIFQFAAVRQCPLLHEVRGIARKMALNDLAGLDRDIRFMPTVSRKEVRRRVIYEIHSDRDAVEVRDSWHEFLSRVMCGRSASACC